jgi:hypothetical protein
MPEYRDDPEYDPYDEPEEFDEPEPEVDDLVLDDDFSGADLAKYEATKKPYRFRDGNGDVWEVPHPDTWSVRAVDAFTHNHLTEWVLTIFEGDAKYAQAFLDMPFSDFRRGMERVGELFETSNRGSNRGERRASARTSRSTRTRSKRR